MRHYHDIHNIRNDPDGFRDRCRSCGEQFIFRRSPSGRIDNRKYLKVHAKDFLQPTNKDFKRFYGDPRQTLKPRTAKEDKELWGATRDEAMREMTRPERTII